MTVWLKLSEKDLQLSAVFVVTVFFQGKRSRRDLKFSTEGGIGMESSVKASKASKVSNLAFYQAHSPWRRILAFFTLTLFARVVKSVKWRLLWPHRTQSTASRNESAQHPIFILVTGACRNAALCIMQNHNLEEF